MSYKQAEFLKKYDTVLFDMDGVITNETVYWKAAALTVREFLDSKNYYGRHDINPAEYMEKADELKDEILCGGETISLFKNRGVNTNWDVIYLILAAVFNSEDEPDWQAVLDFWKDKEMDAHEMCEYAACLLSENLCLPKSHVRLFGDFWVEIQHAFQEWVLGEKIYPHEWHVPCVQSGKSGLLFAEKPLVDGNELKKVLAEISKTHVLGIGTGRPYTEATEALKEFGILEYFDPERIINYNYIAAAEKTFGDEKGDANLKKPHPFTFLKGAFACTVPDKDLISGNYDKERTKKVLVVGDAGADMYSAFAAGCDFAAVLTGIEPAKAKDFFEKEKATYILDSVLSLATKE